MPGPDVTVLIATRDRAEHLGASLDTVLASSAVAPFPTEVLMVDNGSTDGTGPLLAGRSQRWPDLRTVHDPVPGKSGALNRALGGVRGRAVVFTDDDVHVPTTWVADMATPILEGTADAVCGRVELAPALARPWLTPALRMKLAEVSDVSGPSPGMVGANMAASAEAVRAIGFDEELGPGPRARGMGEDVLFNLRLKAAGYRLVGSSGPPVVHHLSADRLRYEPMRKLAQSNGSSHAYLWHHWLHDDLDLLFLRRLRARARLLWTEARTPRDPDSITVREYERWYDLSFVTHLAEERSRPTRYPSTNPAADASTGTPSRAAR
jgi:glycosyltransferase involved in cell wall biosynthesis